MPEPLVAEPQSWALDRFTLGEGSGIACPAVIDITGAARVLVFGPMCPLAAGAWRLTVRFALNETAIRHAYLLQFVQGDHLVEHRFQPTAAGEFEITLDNDYPYDALTALRLWVAEAAFDGELRFLGAAIAPLAAPSPNA